MLSFFSIFGIQNNVKVFNILAPWVVNCFHFSVSLGYKTTYKLMTVHLLRLWIAFIFQYLWDTKQRSYKVVDINASCELLSFFSIFGIQNNVGDFVVSVEPVVNCFHFSVSLGYKTTREALEQLVSELWIAFIFQYLWDTKQRVRDCYSNSKGCELLSFFSIFGIQNNFDSLPFYIVDVVNCFHFSVSLGYKTTK